MRVQSNAVINHTTAKHNSSQYLSNHINDGVCTHLNDCTSSPDASCNYCLQHLYWKHNTQEGAYIVLLPEELAIISWADPVLLLEVVHWDGEVGLRGWRGSGQKHHRLLLCVENRHSVGFINTARLIKFNVVIVYYSIVYKKITELTLQIISVLRI